MSDLQYCAICGEPTACEFDVCNACEETRTECGFELVVFCPECEEHVLHEEFNGVCCDDCFNTPVF